MRSSTFLEYAPVLLLLILEVKSDSQGFTFPTNDNGTRESQSDCNCVIIRSCRAWRNRRDWRTVGKECGQGLGYFRKVCCPKNETLPPISTPKPLLSKPDTECGRSIPRNIFNPNVPCAVDPNYKWFPWTAAIRRRGDTGYDAWCSGFLIDRRHILSAAHCYETRGDDMYRARIGSINQTEGDEYHITNIEVHHGYVAKMFHDDIAILTLDREVNFTGFNPICLPDERNVSFIDREATITGWADDRSGGHEINCLQSMYKLRVISSRECHRALHRKLRNSFLRHFPKAISRGFICTAFEDAQHYACEGYSGGPLMFYYRGQWFAIGITLFGLNCNPGMPGGYTRVSNYLDWIQPNIRN